ncbi:hypothetical protein LZ012_16895 [Dechloromonas sp. XY25]|uniref:Uncharacterized protein n=1 Tax=Dechloromonas hankyongensis TaxID=2908002 RepID=A0ABS9K6B6_9RHOO|nr:hypothetical protein [Dechloromonas hankyongensis]MCG2578678.1 hypothetical protein [Dechloromonas hankyongensis]
MKAAKPGRLFVTFMNPLSVLHSFSGGKRPPGRGLAGFQVAAYGLWGGSPWGLGWLDMVLRSPFVRAGVLEYGASGDVLWDEETLGISGCRLWDEKAVYVARLG